MFSIRPSRPGEHEALFGVWLAAVRATHDFLAEADVDFYARSVREEYLPGATLMVAADDRDGRPVGFAGVSGRNIDMLFVNPAWHGRGVGRALVGRVLADGPEGGVSVDVNEHNRGARAFYERLGFREVGRSALDGAGRPFPLVHLAYGGGAAARP